MIQSRFLLACALAGVLPAVGAAQQASPIAIRQVAPVAAKSTETVGAIRGIRHLPDGRVLVNDAGRRRLLLFAADLASYTVVIDSTLGLSNSYGRIAAPLIPYLGDSTLFVDYTSQSMLVLDEKGKVVRITAPPKASDLSYLTSGNPGINARGQLVYRTYLRAPPPTSASINGPMAPSAPPDSAPIVRADWDTGMVDTLAKIKIPTGSRMMAKPNPAGGMPTAYTMTVNPLTWADDWATTSDGAVAIVRGQDYHLDWIGVDGKPATSPKMAYDWRRLTDDDKQAIVDSVRHVNDSIAATPQGSGVRFSSSSAGGPMITQTIPITYEYVPLKDMPDYYPPIRAGSVLADRDGNVWILPYTSAQGGNKGLVYDVVNRKGEIIERIQVPENSSITGFGKGGIIYLMVPAPLKNPTDRPGSAGFYLERTMLPPTGAIKP